MRVKGFFGKGLVIAAISALVLVVTGTGFCAPAKKVAVFPFTMNSPQDLGFLQNGLFSMLSSRLADPGKVEVLDREAVDAALSKAQQSDLVKGSMTEDKARMIGANMRVDFVLFGSLTNFGESVSLDAKMVDVTGQKKTLSFFEQSNSMGDVIPLVNSFAGDINEKVFNRSIDNKLYVQPAPQEAPAPGALQHAGGSAMYGGGMMMNGQSMGQGFMTHLAVNDVIRAMAMGDLKNDGTPRVVTATDDTLFIYALKGIQLVQEAKLEYASTNRIVSLDIADINKNGYPEIFVTSLTIHLDGLQSFVVEYDGSAFQTLVDGESIYYRVLTLSDGTRQLMGQDKGRGPFSGRIFTMMPDGNGYEKQKRIRSPRNVSVLSMAKGAVTREQADEYVMLNENSKLLVSDDSGSEVWRGNTYYGGLGTYWLMPQNDSDSSYREMAYLQSRIQLFDVNNDGAQNVITIKNIEASGGVLGRYKRFKEGLIEVLAWNGIGMAPIFQTLPVQGWISDYALGDLDGDGKKELVVSVVSRSKWAILGKDKGSNIISYKIE